ncbi:MAG: YmdB family metallophosphoesterase [Deltaproteobacteria bacterium]|jgi:metallophosphoesterase (TIGR00282 family)|nr:YmdB family metallophosphoesterase [Deltaproteobacteria bacterium]
MLKILFLGDIFGNAGRRALHANLRPLARSEGVDVTLANGENAAGGVGVTRAVARKLLNQGISLLSGGNHSFHYREAEDFLDQEPRVLRPANYPSPCPGRGWGVALSPTGQKVALVSVMGRSFMNFSLDCPFKTVDRILEELRVEAPLVTIVDFHAEATGEKKAMGLYLDGRVSAVVGTHTHVQTNDAQILPKGTAYITDVGMSGPHGSIIGMRQEAVLASLLTGRRQKFSPSQSVPCLQGALLTFDDEGQALFIKAFTLPNVFSQTMGEEPIKEPSPDLDLEPEGDAEPFDDDED